MARTRILVIEDDEPIRIGLVDALRHVGFEVAEAARGDTGLELALTGNPDLVLLDVVMPGIDGFEVLEELRRSRPQLAVIMLTARGSEEDRVRGLREGADDYVVKPFSATELIARVEAVLRRSAERPRDLAELTLDDRRIDFDRLQVVLRDGMTLKLSELEASLVRYLVINRGRPIDRREILQRVWGGCSREMETRTVDMHVRRLREKLEADPSSPRHVVTIRGRGYMFAEEGS